jgi:hypothetical protein
MGVAPGEIGAGTEIGPGYTLENGSGCLTIGVHLMGRKVSLSASRSGFDRDIGVFTRFNGIGDLPFLVYHPFKELSATWWVTYIQQSDYLTRVVHFDGSKCNYRH